MRILLKISLKSYYIHGPAWDLRMLQITFYCLLWILKYFLQESAFTNRLISSNNFLSLYLSHFDVFFPHIIISNITQFNIKIYFYVLCCLCNLSLYFSGVQDKGLRGFVVGRDIFWKVSHSLKLKKLFVSWRIISPYLSHELSIYLVEDDFWSSNNKT